MRSRKLGARLPPWDAHRADPRGFTFGERSLHALCFFSSKRFSIAPMAAGISLRPVEPRALSMGITMVPAPVLPLLGHLHPALVLLLSPWH